MSIMYSLTGIIVDCMPASATGFMLFNRHMEVSGTAWLPGRNGVKGPGSRVISLTR